MLIKMLNFLLISSIIFFLFKFTTTSAQSCLSYKFVSNQVFRSCNDLPYLNSFLHYNYNSDSKSLQIAYRHTGLSSSRWVAWAINPTASGMIGAQALVAFQKSDGSIRAYTSPVPGGYQTKLQEGNLSFPVSDLKATYSNNEMIIFATLNLQSLGSNVNQVWQEGPVSSDNPGMHQITGPNVQSAGTLNLVSGESGTATSGGLRIKKKNTHGVLNAVSWGILMPMGAIIARYLKVFPSADPAWFYLHASCQVSGYIVGVAGWATGIHLGNQSKGIQYTSHRVIGILIFCFATVQVFALLLRPKKDHKLRFFWNIYHHSLGYAIIILSIVNIFKGFDILDPEKKWKRAYIGVLIGLGAVAVVLEAITWLIVIKRKKSGEVHHKNPHGVNGTRQSEDI